MYDIFAKLCEINKVTPYRVCKETGITTATISNWKAGRYVPKQDKMKKLADYFGVSVEYLTTGEEPQLEKDASTQLAGRDIAKRFDDIIGDINDPDGSPLYFDGVELDDKTKEIMAAFVTNVRQQFELMREMAKKK